LEFGEELREIQSRTDGYEESTTVLNLYTEKINVKILYSGARREKLDIGKQAYCRVCLTWLVFQGGHYLPVCWKKRCYEEPDKLTTR